MRAPLLDPESVDAVYGTGEAVADYDGAPLESWNNPKSNILKVLVAFIGFTVMGLTDSAIGALLPSIEQHYDLSDVQVSLAILIPFAGSLVSTVLSNWFHYQLGRGGVAILGVACMLCNYLCAQTCPPFPVLVMFFTVGGMGAGLLNGTLNAWIGAFADAHGVLGVLQGFYALGGIVGPALITYILSQGVPWYFYYRVMAIVAACLLVVDIYAFRKDGPQQYREKCVEDDSSDEESESASFWDAFHLKQVWLLSALVYCYQGTEMGLSHWVVTYMIRARHGDPKKMGLISSCLWTGLTLGRIMLGFVTGRFKNQKRVVSIYFAAALVADLAFWFITGDIASSAVAIFAIGFFTGPAYPSAMILATSILPKRMHVPGISAATGLAGVGAAMFPVVIGAALSLLGAPSLQPIIFFFLSLTTCIWILMPSH